MDPPSGSQPTAPGNWLVTAAKLFWEINHITRPLSCGPAGNTHPDWQQDLRITDGE